MMLHIEDKLNNSVTEQYCSFELSKMLKNFNFNVPSYTVYNDIGGIICNDQLKTNSESCQEGKEAFTCTAPTYDCVISWLVVNYNIFVSIGTNGKEWWYEIQDVCTGKKTQLFGNWGSVFDYFFKKSEAIENGIMTCVENLFHLPYNFSRKYVNLRVAKTLRECGYNEKCDHIWISYGEDKKYMVTTDEIFKETGATAMNVQLKNGQFTAPTIEMVSQWLKNTFKMVVTVKYFPVENKYTYILNKIGVPQEKFEYTTIFKRKYEYDAYMDGFSIALEMCPKFPSMINIK